jgi:uncharacterized membrane protein YesL
MRSSAMNCILLVLLQLLLQLLLPLPLLLPLLLCSLQPLCLMESARTAAAPP